MRVFRVTRGGGHTGERLETDVRKHLPRDGRLDGEIVLPVRSERLTRDNLCPFACGCVLHSALIQVRKTSQIQLSHAALTSSDRIASTLHPTG
jgi:hypothetical protein